MGFEQPTLWLLGCQRIQLRTLQLYSDSYFDKINIVENKDKFK